MPRPGAASLPGLSFPFCTGEVGAAGPWRPSGLTRGLSTTEAARPLTRLRPSSPEGAGPRRPALTRLTLQRHQGYQVVGDVKKGEHRHARKGKGQLIPRRGHDDDLPRQPGRRVPSSRGEGWGRGGRGHVLRRGPEEPRACALAPARGGAGPRVSRATGAPPSAGGRGDGVPAVSAGPELVLQIRAPPAPGCCKLCRAERAGR